MAKKVRLWICRKCRRVYKRKKHVQKVYRCCGQLMKKARKWPDEKWWEGRKNIRARMEKKADKSQKKLDNLISVPRCSHGKKLRATKRLTKLWERIEGMERTALTYWSQKFVEELHKHAIHRYGINGRVEAPKVRMERKRVGDAGLYGRYTSGFLSEYSIKVRKTLDLDEMKSTLLNECLHHVDAEGKRMPGGLGKVAQNRGHDGYWVMRLVLFKKMLRVKSQKILEAR